MSDHLIKGPTGSIRGHKHLVQKSRAKLSQLECSSLCSSDSDCESSASSTSSSDITSYGHVVFYSTSISVVRSTFEASNRLRAILAQNGVRYEERDLYLDESFRNELKEGMDVPCVLLDGIYFGSLDQVESLNERGLLRSLLPVSTERPFACGSCGNARYVPCSRCSGSTRSCVLRFPKGKLVSLRCSLCSSATGLIPCPKCTQRSS